jgi:diguanylate cyclase (GGDEF)-like protein
MSSSPPETGWFRWFSRQVLRLGLLRANLLHTGLVWLFAVAVSQGVISVSGHGDRGVALFSATLCVLLLAPPFGWLVLRLVFELESARRQLAVLAMNDDLTGVYNRRHFMWLAEHEWARCRRYDTGGAVLLIDADHFKRVNDTHGHLAGDALLREMAAAAARSLRQPDLLARFGGEELIVFLPHTDPLGALDVAERIREQVAMLQLPWQGQNVGTTVSIGVAALSAAHASLEAVVHDADVALYEAKAAGRNCVRAAPTPSWRSGEQINA